MTAAAKKYNPGFLTDDELVSSFCVRTSEFDSIVEALRESTGASNVHQLVIGPRGSGKTSLLLRVAAEIRCDKALSPRLFPVVFAEESYGVGSPGEFWLECLRRLADQAPQRAGEPDLGRIFEDLRNIQDDQLLADRCLGAVQDFSDRAAKRLVLIVENLNMMFGDMPNADTAAWRLRETLQTDPRIALLASATSRFDQIDHPDRALYDLFRTLQLRPLDTKECAVLWETVSGRHRAPSTIRSLEILTGGSPRLLSILARFGGGLSFQELMAQLLDLIDDHTEYFKSHLESLPAQERRVYLALAELWKPASTREIADQARLDTSKCSAQLKRLVERGAVVVAGGSARRKLHYLAERLYNIYYLLRQRRGSDPLLKALVRFMASYYSPEELKDVGVQAIEAYSAEISKQGQVTALTTRSLANLIRDTALCQEDIKTILAILPELEITPPDLVKMLLVASIKLGAAPVREWILASPAADLLLPLTTALDQEIGLETHVAQEVDEVAQDIRRDLQKLREASEQADRGRNAGFPAPPAQIRTGPLRHPAPPSGHGDGQTLARPWVSDCQLRPVVSGPFRQGVPTITVLLGAAA